MSIATKERPILFSGEMVRAILDGRKTMTRRVVKHAESIATVVGRNANGELSNDVPREIPDWQMETLLDECPYGHPGEQLWVRECWGDRADYAAIGSLHKERVYYAADGRKDGWKYRPSIYMPRWASRITLEITDVRVERLKDITGADCRAEGCEPDWDAFHEATYDMEGWEEPEDFIEECEEEGDWINYGRRLVHSSEHKEWERDRENYALSLAFRNLWERINGDGSWDANPWVWVISFKRIKP